MNCPVCKIPLNLSERQGVEIDYCPQCRGVWLDRGELDKIIEKSLVVNPPRGEYPTVYPQSPPMQPYPKHHGNDRLYDHHEDQHGRRKQKSWLGELFD
jgi:uncharacterized protein